MCTRPKVAAGLRLRRALHAAAPKDAAACAWMHRPSPPPPARANRAQKQRQPDGTLPSSKLTPMRHFGSSFKRRCRHRWSFSLSSSSPPPPSYSAAARRTMATRASRALAAARSESASCGHRGRFKSKLCHAVACRFMAVRFLALVSMGEACCQQAPTPNRSYKSYVGSRFKRIHQWRVGHAGLLFRGVTRTRRLLLD
jgi:hypothetical protein